MNTRLPTRLFSLFLSLLIVESSLSHYPEAAAYPTLSQPVLNEAFLKQALTSQLVAHQFTHPAINTKLTVKLIRMLHSRGWSDRRIVGWMGAAEEARLSAGMLMAALGIHQGLVPIFGPVSFTAVYLVILVSRPLWFSFVHSSTGYRFASGKLVIGTTDRRPLALLSAALMPLYATLATSVDRESLETVLMLGFLTTAAAMGLHGAIVNAWLAPKFQTSIALLGSPLSEAARTFIDQVIEPVSGPLPSPIEMLESPTGALSISHAWMERARSRTFRYRIEFHDTEIQTPLYPSLTEENVIRVPRGPWSEETTEDLKDAWRRMTIADPLLNRRFQTQGLDEIPFQRLAIAAAVRDATQYRHALVVMATGTGKTYVAFEAMRQLLASQERKGAVLFFVNNTDILSQAEAYLHQYYGTQFKTGSIYGGEGESEEDAYDAETDVIFATPASLFARRRLEKLLAKRRIDIVISDEVHHLPAPTYRRVFSRIQEQNTGTVFLGFTATEIRHDEASVVRFFGHRTSFRYPLARAWKQGYLTRLRNVMADQDILRQLGKDPAEVKRLLPGSDLYGAFRQRQYDDSRFPFLLESYRAQTNATAGRRGLILAPTIERANALSTYFTENNEATITLTSEDKTRDPLLFEHRRLAWKTGHWPKDSPFQDQPVPRTVIAVDMFREGTDVPDIDVVMLWSDLESAAAYVQSIGRGLRPARFKTHLTLLDAVGLTRKERVLQWLFKLAQETRFEDHSSAAGPSERLLLRPSDTGISMETDILRMVADFLTDLPGHLDSTFGAYHLIPPERIQELDAYLAQEMGFEEKGRPAPLLLLEFLQETARHLLANENPEASWMRSVRTRLSLAFRRSLASEAAISINDTTRLVYFRLRDLLIRTVQAEDDSSPLTDDHLRILFPEFDPARLERVRTRGRNMQALRKIAFGLDRTEMTRRLIADFESEHEARLQIEEGALATHLRHEATILSRKDPATLSLAFAEATQVKLDESHLTSQEQMLAVYLANKRLRDAGLAETDFELAPEKFIQRLVTLGLARTHGGLTNIFRFLDAQATAYHEEALKHLTAQNSEGLDRARTALISLLANASEEVQVEQQEVSDNAVKQLLKLSEFLDETRRMLGDKRTDEDERIRRERDRLFEVAGIRSVFQPEEMPGVQIVLEKARGTENYSIAVLSEHSALRPVIGVSLRRDAVNRMHAFILDRPDVVLESNIAALYDYLAELTLSQQTAFLDSLPAVFAGLSEMAGNDLIFVIPREWPAKEDGEPRTPFFEALMDRLLSPDQTYPAYVLGPIQNVTTRPHSRGSLVFLDETATRSRLPELSADQLETMRRTYASAMGRIDHAKSSRARPNDGRLFMTPAEKLAEHYLAWHYWWNVFRGAVPTLERKISALSVEDGIEPIARAVLDKVSWMIRNHPDGRYYTRASQAALEILDTDHAETPLTALQIHLAYLHLSVLARYRFNILRAPAHRLEVAWRNLHQAMSQTDQRMPPDLAAQLSDFADFLSAAAQQRAALTDVEPQNTWLRSSRDIRDSLLHWAEIFERAKAQHFEEVETEIERERKRVVETLYSQAQGSSARVAYASTRSSPAKGLLIFFAKREARTRVGNPLATMIAHISPECPHLLSTKEPVHVLRSSSKDSPFTVMHLKTEEIELCPHCPHGLADYPSGTPRPTAWNDIDNKYRDFSTADWTMALREMKWINGRAVNFKELHRRTSKQVTPEEEPLDDSLSGESPDEVLKDSEAVTDAEKTAETKALAFLNNSGEEPYTTLVRSTLSQGGLEDGLIDQILAFRAKRGELKELMDLRALPSARGRIAQIRNAFLSKKPAGLIAAWAPVISFLQGRSRWNQTRLMPDRSIAFGLGGIEEAVWTGGLFILALALTGFWPLALAIASGVKRATFAPAHKSGVFYLDENGLFTSATAQKPSRSDLKTLAALGVQTPTLFSLSFAVLMLAQPFAPDLAAYSSLAFLFSLALASLRHGKFNARPGRNPFDSAA